jgi:hypothetical protein
MHGIARHLVGRENKRTADVSVIIESWIACVVVSGIARACENQLLPIDAPVPLSILI